MTVEQTFNQNAEINCSSSRHVCTRSLLVHCPVDHTTTRNVIQVFEAINKPTHIYLAPFFGFGVGVELALDFVDVVA